MSKVTSPSRLNKKHSILFKQQWHCVDGSCMAMGPWGDKCCRNVVTYDGVVEICLSIADRIRRSAGVVTLWKFYEQLQCISK